MAVNGQSVAMRTFNQTVTPSGEVAVRQDGRENGRVVTKRLVYNDWDEYSLTQWVVEYDTAKASTTKITKTTVLFDEIDLKSAIAETKNVVLYDEITYLELKSKELKSSVSYTVFNPEFYEESAVDSFRIYTASAAESTQILEQLKEKAYEMSLELNLEGLKRTTARETMRYDADHPDGIDIWEYEKTRQTENTSAEDDSAATADEEAPEPSAADNSSDNRPAPAPKTEILVKLRNKTDNTLDIVIDTGGRGSSKTTTSLNGRTTKSFRIKVGGRVLGPGGNVLLTATADMDGTEQIIAR